MSAVPAEIFVTNQKRDGRGLNRMDPETKWVHERLEAWIPFARDRGIASYPTQSPTEKAALYGGLGIPQESQMKPEPQMPFAEAATDWAVSQLGQIDGRVIDAYYLHWADNRSLANRLRMREKQFENVLGRARRNVGAHIKAYEAFNKKI